MTALAIATRIASRVRVSPVTGQVAGPVDLLLGKNVRTGPLTPASSPGVVGAVPDECVWVTPTGGLPDEPFHGGDGTNPARDVNPEDWSGISRPTYDVTIRGRANDYDRTASLAEAVHLGIDKSIPGGYFEMRAPRPPAWVRRDDQGRHVFVFPLEGRTCR